MSRCGLGGTSPKPVLTTMEKFPELYRSRLVKETTGLLPSFDLAAALAGQGDGNPNGGRQTS